MRGHKVIGMETGMWMVIIGLIIGLTICFCEMDALIRKLNMANKDKQAIQEELNDRTNEIRESHREVTSLHTKLNKQENAMERQVNESHRKITDLNDKITEKETDIENLKESLDEISDLSKELAKKEIDIDQLMGAIERDILDFHVSDGLKSSLYYSDGLEKMKDKTREIVMDDRVINNVYTGNSKETKKIAKDMSKIALMLFDTIADRACLSVRYGNFERWHAKILKTHATINIRFRAVGLELSVDYLKAKLDELIVYHQYQCAKQKEKEEAKEIRLRAAAEKREREQLDREQARLEEQLRKEMEIESIREETKRNLEKNIQEVQMELLKRIHTSGKEKEGLEEEIQELRKNLEELQQENEQQESMLREQLAVEIATIEERKEVLQAGFVYIISNEGAFGKGVYKIGATRRSDPLDRVNELGNASVPFKFCVNAIIASDRAFKLENDIHNLLREHRVNIVNNHKEFFRLEADELIEKVYSIVPELEFNKEVQEPQFIESEEIRNDPAKFKLWVSKFDKIDTEDSEEKQHLKLGIIDSAKLAENNTYSVTEDYTRLFNVVQDNVCTDGLSSTLELRVTKYYTAVYLKLDTQMKRLCTMYKNGDSGNVFGFSINGYTGEETCGTRNSIQIDKLEDDKYVEILKNKAVEIDYELIDICDSL